MQDIELDENTFTFKLEDDVYSIGVILKQYLRELPEPLFPLPHAERVKYTEHRGEYSMTLHVVMCSERSLDTACCAVWKFTH